VFNPATSPVPVLCCLRTFALQVETGWDFFFVVIEVYVVLIKGVQCSVIAMLYLTTWFALPPFSVCERLYHGSSQTCTRRTTKTIEALREEVEGLRVIIIIMLPIKP
jgi:hypothetical protein